ncbi:uncharacterized protein LOC115629680 [Scaptodrosophila lebanonensis]|uniref:Uncharacterized protein LOC115629680 n=1 Tax=Drosophila lebanonensis TaxID=7225 RepID=A0A6J2U2H7_DROLE|nr:uncharacterized protein LOC115629680 [Scaptodrosophila lebanonensis]
MTAGHFRLVAAILGGLCISTALSQVPTMLEQSEESEFEVQLFKLLQKIFKEEPFDTLLLYTRPQQNCAFHSLSSNWPTVLVTNGSTDYDWNYSSTALVLACDDNAEQEESDRTLFKLRQARRLVRTDTAGPEHAATLCELYFELEQHNIVLLDENFASTGVYYSCRKFLSAYAVLVEQQLSSLQPAYVKQFRNMQGALILTDVDQLAPRSMLYQDKQSGEMKMMGYCASLLLTYAKRVNATLKLRLDQEIGHVIFYGDIHEWARQNLIDIATAMSINMMSRSFDHISYPYMISSYCLMMPLPQPVPYNVVYGMIIDPLVVSILLLLFCIFSLLLIYTDQLSWRHLSFSNVLFNDRTLRGLLGQSFPMVANPSRHLKLICFLLCSASILITTMYEAYLNAYFTHPPSEPFIRSVESIARSHLRVLAMRRETKVLLAAVGRTPETVEFQVVDYIDDINQLIQTRNSLNTSFAYPVTELRWRTYQEQQKLFKRPLFYYSKDICLNEFMLLCLPMRKELPYRDLFEMHILYVQQFGLMEHWVERSFYQMVQLGLTPLKDLSHPSKIEDAILVEDLIWIFALYLALQALNCFCFVGELLKFRWQRRTLGRARKPRQRINKGQHKIVIGVARSPKKIGQRPP